MNQKTMILDALRSGQSLTVLEAIQLYGCYALMRTINVWRKQLRPELFETLAIEPAAGVVDASIWRRNKKTGTVTQFVRGKAMQDYRAALIKADGTDD